ncbi:MAG: hypothetical protein IJ485_01465 [Lachnospiraceae bacterium]|nr:hypothetical protein [Lachnospiraceae bacterium]
MELNRFIHKVMQGVEEFSGEDVHVEIKKIVKNNNVILDGLIIMKKGQNISPTIYLNDYFQEYQKGKPVSAIVYEIIKLYEEKQFEGKFDVDFFTDYQNVQGKIAYKLVNYKKNEQLLKEIPHITFLDMAIVFYCIVAGDAFGNATILIYQNHCRMWGVTVWDIYEVAKRNMTRLLPHAIQNIEELINDILQTEEIESETVLPMYVLTNRTKLFGAACILYEGVLETFAEQFGRDIYILPSSIHEVILIPDSGNFDSRQLEEMVREVNMTQLETQEILSDSVYRYDRINKKIDFAASAEIVE